MRLNFVQFILFLFGFLLIARSVQIQIVNHAYYSRLAEIQYNDEKVLPARRGLIYDRNAVDLALNKPGFDIGVDPKFFTATPANIRKLSEILNMPEALIAKKIGQGGVFVPLRKGVDDPVANALRKTGLKGITIDEKSRRVYPFDETLAQVLGFVDVDGKGLSGVELTYDRYLKGQNGWTILQKDAIGRDISAIESATKEPIRGDDVTLTIDYVLQTIAEEELQAAVARFRAKGGSVVITRPQTGEILAMATFPTFDANRAHQYRPETWRIRSITDIFEPGSTFKIVTMMAALSYEVKTTDDILFCENGKYKLYGHEITDAEKHGWLSFENVFIKSSNIGAAKIAQEVGKRKLFTAARALGFGNKTGVGLSGEVSGILKKPTDWSEFSLAAISYGYEVAVTPLQMAMAYGAVANGGLLMQPRIIKEIKSSQGKSIRKFEPRVTRTVMARQTANTMARIFKRVVAEGTGRLARIPGYEIAGKTGTAKKPRPDKRGYSNRKFVASFVGFYPVQQPRVLISVVIDEPYPTHSGGKVAAPTFRRILDRIIKIYNDPPANYGEKYTIQDRKSKKVRMPDFKGRRIDTALQLLKSLKIKYRVEGDGPIVVSQSVRTPSRSGGKAVLILHTRDGKQVHEATTMPELVGLTVRKAISQLAMRNLDARIVGSGKVVRQKPQAGAKMKVGARCLLECKPKLNVSLLGK